MPTGKRRRGRILERASEYRIPDAIITDRENTNEAQPSVLAAALAGRRVLGAAVLFSAAARSVGKDVSTTEECIATISRRLC